MLLLLFACLSHLVVAQADNRDAYVASIKAGMEMQARGSYDSAIAKFREAATRQPKPSTAYYQMAYSFMLTGRPDSVLKYADQVITYHDTNEPLAIVLKAFVWERSEATLGQASSLVREAVARFPNDPGLWYQYGVISSMEGNSGEAERGFLTSLKLRSAFPDLHFDYGKSQGMQFTAFFPLYYFLLLETNSARSEDAFNTLLNLLKFLRWASAGETPPTEKLEVYVQGTVWFLEDLLPSAVQEYESMTQREPWVDTWYTFYVKFFTDMLKDGHGEAFVFMTAQTSKEPAAIQWLKDHPAKVDLFMAWLKSSGR